jgi:hypothetical protein
MAPRVDRNVMGRDAQTARFNPFGDPMKKHLLIAAASAALVLPSLWHPLAAEPSEQTVERHPLSAEDSAAFTDARIAALKAGLELSATQEKSWPALETALREVAKARAARAAEWREKAGKEKEHRSAIEQLQGRAKGLTSRAAELERIADSAKPLFDSLDDAQKRRFGILLRGFSSWRGQRGDWGGGHHGWHAGKDAG